MSENVEDNGSVNNTDSQSNGELSAKRSLDTPSVTGQNNGTPLSDTQHGAQGTSSENGVASQSRFPIRLRSEDPVDFPLAQEPGLTGQITTVHVLRHGEVDNPTGILYGRLQGYSLSPLGFAQADRAAQALKDADITAIFASPLLRAQQTARPSALLHGLDIQINDALIESGNDFEGKVVNSKAFSRSRGMLTKIRDPFTPSWGEPYLNIGRRMSGAIYAALDAARGHEALCVSHQLPIWTLRRFLEGRRLWHDPRSRQCSLGSITSFVFDGNTLTDIRYSEPSGSSDPSQTGA